MANVTDICNLALQKLGAARISSIDEDSRNARECKTCFNLLRDKELRAHRWIFATKIQVLAAISPTPLSSRPYVYQLPPDCLRLISPAFVEDNSNWRDWVRIGNTIHSNDGTPLQISYIAQITDPSLFDAAFVEGLACKIAYHLCFQITNANTKKPELEKEYRMAIGDAKRCNALERVPEVTVEDYWVTVRQ